MLRERRLEWPWNALRRCAVALAFVLGLAGRAHAEETPSSPCERAIAFPGQVGMSGFDAMVDARSPMEMAVRGGLRYALSEDRRRFKGPVPFDQSEEAHSIGPLAGVTYEFLEAGARLSYISRHREDRFRDGSAGDQSVIDNGGELVVGAKATLPSLVPNLSLAPYLVGTFALTTRTDEPTTVEYGLGATWVLPCAAGRWVAIHGDVAGEALDVGLAAFRARLGTSLAVGPELHDDVLLRVYGFGDLTQYEGRARADVDVSTGIQCLLWKYLSFELGATVRVAASGMKTRREDRELWSAATTMPDNTSLLSGEQRFDDRDRLVTFHAAITVIF